MRPAGWPLPTLPSCPHSSMPGPAHTLFTCPPHTLPLSPRWLADSPALVEGGSFLEHSCRCECVRRAPFTGFPDWSSVSCPVKRWLIWVLPPGLPHALKVVTAPGRAQRGPTLGAAHHHQRFASRDHEFCP